MEEENNPRSDLPIFVSDVWILISKNTEIRDFANLRQSCHALYTHQRISQEFNRRRWIDWYSHYENPFDERISPEANALWNHCLYIAREAPDAETQLARISHQIASRKEIPNNAENWPPRLANLINTIIINIHRNGPATSHVIDALIGCIETLNGNTPPQQYRINNISQRESIFAYLKWGARLFGFPLGVFSTCVGILIRTVGPPEHIPYANIIFGVSSGIIGASGVIEVVSHPGVRKWCHARIFQPAPAPINDEEAQRLLDHDDVILTNINNRNNP